VIGQPDPVPTKAEDGVNTTHPCCQRMGDANPRRGAGEGRYKAKGGWMDVRLIKPQMWTIQLYNFKASGAIV